MFLNGHPHSGGSREAAADPFEESPAQWLEQLQDARQSFLKTMRDVCPIREKTLKRAAWANRNSENAGEHDRAVLFLYGLKPAPFKKPIQANPLPGRPVGVPRHSNYRTRRPSLCGG